MIRIASALLLTFIAVPCWAQFWIEPAVNFGTTRLNWQDSVELKTSKLELEVGFGYRQNAGFSYAASFTTRREMSSVQDGLTPFTVNAQTFGKKSGQAKGQAQAGQGSQETVLVDASVVHGAFGAYFLGGVFNPTLRCELLSLSISAKGKIDGKQVEATETFTRLYPQVGLAYTHRQGPAFMTLLGTVGQRSSHLEANLNWNIRPDVWIGIGGKRDYLGFEQGRVESAAFALKAGVVF